MDGWMEFGGNSAFCFFQFPHFPTHISLLLFSNMAFYLSSFEKGQGWKEWGLVMVGGRLMRDEKGLFSREEDAGGRIGFVPFYFFLSFLFFLFSFFLFLE